MRSRYVVILAAIGIALSSAGASCGNVISKSSRGSGELGGTGRAGGHTGGSSAPIDDLRTINSGRSKVCRNPQAHEYSEKAQGTFDETEDVPPVC